MKNLLHSVKIFLARTAFSIITAIVSTGVLYSPLYLEIPLSNADMKMDAKIEKLELPIGPYLREILERKIDLPLDRHKICLNNKNKVYLAHADNYIDNMPYSFFTHDISSLDIARETRVGAMAIDLYYLGFDRDELYRVVSDPTFCLVLNTSKIKKFASSTVLYSYPGYDVVNELDLGEKGKLVVRRPVIGGYFIDTAESSAYIRARFDQMLFTFFALAAIFQALIEFLKNFWINKKE